MADEVTKPPYKREAIVPDPWDWANLLQRDGDELEVHYRRMLEALARERGMLGTTFLKAKNEITEAVRQTIRLMGEIDEAIPGWPLT